VRGPSTVGLGRHLSKIAEKLSRAERQHHVVGDREVLEERHAAFLNAQLPARGTSRGVT
jgi:hypothetical protein